MYLSLPINFPASFGYFSASVPWIATEALLWTSFTSNWIVVFSLITDSSIGEASFSTLFSSSIGFNSSTESVLSSVFSIGWSASTGTVLVSTFSVDCASWTLFSTFSTGCVSSTKAVLLSVVSTVCTSTGAVFYYTFSTTWTSSTRVVFSTKLVSVVLVFWLFTAVSSLVDAAL